jgi:hypothetical protein
MKETASLLHGGGVLSYLFFAPQYRTVVWLHFKWYVTVFGLCFKWPVFYMGKILSETYQVLSECMKQSTVHQLETCIYIKCKQCQFQAWLTSLKCTHLNKWDCKTNSFMVLHSLLRSVYEILAIPSFDNVIF